MQIVGTINGRAFARNKMRERWIKVRAYPEAKEPNLSVAIGYKDQDKAKTYVSLLPEEIDDLIETLEEGLKEIKG